MNEAPNHTMSKNGIDFSKIRCKKHKVISNIYDINNTTLLELALIAKTGVPILKDS